MKYLKKWYAMLCLLLGTGMITSCGMMEDDRSDCPTGLYVSFKYDYNLQRADMFGDHVGGVTLYVFDEAGKLVRVQEEGNTPIARPLAAVDYKMHLSGLQPGKYPISGPCRTKVIQRYDGYGTSAFCSFGYDGR